MKKSGIVRSFTLAVVAMGGLAAPTPAAAVTEDLHQCMQNCYLAYVVQTQQPLFYQMCVRNCIQLYGNFAAPSAISPLAVTRYS